MDLALLILRVVVGLLVAGHGAQKLFGWFKGPGVAGMAGWLGSVGFRPARLWAMFAGWAEFGGGLLLALGFLSPLGSLGIASSMLMATAKVHWPKVWVTENGMELTLTNLAATAAVGIAGPGAYSLDAILGTELPNSVAVGALVVTVIGWIAGIVISRRPPKHEEATSLSKAA